MRRYLRIIETRKGRIIEAWTDDSVPQLSVGVSSSKKVHPSLLMGWGLFGLVIGRILFTAVLL